MNPLQQMLDGNRAWVEQVKAQDATFFDRLAHQQAPEYLWIGCADSRVPSTQIAGMMPGEIFVHRNVANVVVHTDLNCLSVMQFAVEVLQVKHIIVCGHYGCGGVNAALHNRKFGLIDNWLRHVQDVAAMHAGLLASVSDDQARFDRLCELNVIEQVHNVCQSTIVQDAWARGQTLAVHGLIYSVADGLLQDMQMIVSGQAELERSHRRAVERVAQRAA
jgi:carbonic anhydrase